MIGRAAASVYLIRRRCLWRNVDDNIPVILVNILLLVISGARRALPWRGLQLHPAAQLQHQAHRQAQQKDNEGRQEQQLHNNTAGLMPTIPKSPQQRVMGHDCTEGQVSPRQQKAFSGPVQTYMEATTCSKCL